MKKLLFLSMEIWKGKSVTRAFLNLRLSAEFLTGNVIDIGGGKNADYISFIKKHADVDFQTFDLKAGASINFEKDIIPAHDGQYDTVLFLNVMEHIYNYQHIANEVVRITKNNGRLIGFVPFLMWYHPDHSDYFRYTHEALERIFKQTEATDIYIEPIARGPFMAACHMVLQSFPRITRVPIFVFFYFLDSLFLSLRFEHGSKFALGYFFSIKK